MENLLYYQQCIANDVKNSMLIGRALSTASCRLLHWSCRWFWLFLCDFIFLDLKKNQTDKRTRKATFDENEERCKIFVRRSCLWKLDCVRCQHSGSDNTIKNEVWEQESMTVAKRSPLEVRDQWRALREAAMNYPDQLDTPTSWKLPLAKYL